MQLQITKIKATYTYIHKLVPGLFCWAPSPIFAGLHRLFLLGSIAWQFLKICS